MEAQRITRPLEATGARRQVALPPTMVRAEQIAKRFAGEVGVFDLNFEVPTGSIFGMIGPSGCGKTTTVRLMTGLYKPDRGNLTVMNRTPSKFTPRDRERLGYMPQHFVLYPNLTVWENLNFVASLYGMGYFARRKSLEQALEFVEMSDARNRLGSQLSGGMQRRLELACTLVHNPLLIFADEPTAGIDPVLRGKFWDHFRHLRDTGRTLFVTTQYVGEAVYCDMVAVMRDGRIMYLDTPENLRKRALGGDMIKLVVDPPHTLDAAQLFQRHPAIADVRRSRSRPGLLYLYTENASATLPLIFQIMSEHPDIKVQQADKYVPPFDDVFVKLMEQAEEEYAKRIIRLLSFFSKEVNELRRQPKLILSLLLGPFLILLLFGVGYQGERPKLRTALVVPQQSVDAAQLDALKKAIGTNFTLVRADSDQDGALKLLQDGQIDVVETLPANLQQNLLDGKQSQVDFKYNAINPLNEQWVQYLAYAQVNEINRTVQTQAIRQIQGELEKRGVQSEIPIDLLVTPVKPTYYNVQGNALNLMTFYAPGVMALILQHIAVTLAALSLVRERLLGAMELFRVAPVSLRQVLLGKYLGYTLFIGIITAALICLLVFTPLAVPFLGSVPLFVGLTLLFTLASLGIGFMISAWSSSDSQAVQLSMLVLLMSIFFSGFFLPLENFWTPIRAIGYALPLTHAISGFQNVMLRGRPPSEVTWLALGIIAALTFVLSSLLAQWRFRQLD